MHKIVLDANILISAIISNGYPYRILHNLAATERMKICLSEPILNGYTEVVLRTKFAQYKDFKQNALFIITNIKRVGKLYNPNIHLKIITDNKFLELAIFSKANFLITGNTNQFTISEYNGVKIISPKDYIKNYWKV